MAFLHKQQNNRKQQNKSMEFGHQLHTGTLLLLLFQTICNQKVVFEGEFLGPTIRGTIKSQLSDMLDIPYSSRTTRVLPLVTEYLNMWVSGWDCSFYHAD